MGMFGKSKDKGGAEAQTKEPRLEAPLHPPAWLRMLRWFAFVCTVALAIGMLALINQHLTSIPSTYQGSMLEYVGRPIAIQYCLLSSSTAESQESRCGFALAAVSISLALSLMWSYMQVLRRNPFKHPSARRADLVLCAVWLAWWVACAIVLCAWADQANKAGSFLGSTGKAQRNGLATMAWIMFLFVALLTGTAALMVSESCQALFDKWEEQGRAKKAAKEQEKLRAKQQDAAQRSAGAAAAGAQPGMAAAPAATPARAAGAAPGIAAAGPASGPNNV